MKPTVSLDVKWLWIFVAATLLAVSLTLLRRSGVRGPLSAAIFLVCEGALALPLLGYFVGLTVTKNLNPAAPWVGALIGSLACTAIFASVRLWESHLSEYYEGKFGQSVQLIWTQRAAILGCLGMGIFLTEIARLTSTPQGPLASDLTREQALLQLQKGVMAAGAASAGLVLLEFLALTFCNYFWDFQWKGIVPYDERLGSWQSCGIVLVTVGIVCVGIMKNYQPYIDRYTEGEIAKALEEALEYQAAANARIQNAEPKTEFGK